MSHLVTFRGGRKRPQPARPHLKYGALRPAKKRPTPPASADWLTPVQADAWGMLGNDRIGDCTAAGVAHKRIGDAFVNQGVTLTITEDDAIRFYEHFGYDPRDPDTDQGARCQDVLEWWQKHGFNGERILAFAKVDLSDEAEVKDAIAVFGSVYCGFMVPDSAMQQFNGGQPWDLVRGARDEGGHCVIIGGYDKDGLTSVTWGALQRMSWAFFRAQFDEMWVIITPDMIDPTTGLDHLGMSLTQLETQFTGLTGRHVAVDLAA